MSNNLFKEELTDLINKHGVDKATNTPDFIVAKYLLGCLAVFNKTVNKRREWYGERTKECT